MEYEYTIIRSGRKTVGLEIYPDGRVIVRVPHRMSDGAVEVFMKERRDWILRKLKEIEGRKRKAERAGLEKLSPEDIRILSDRAAKVIPKRVAHYAPVIGVTYGRITIRTQKTRWGSCSQKGNLNFNCLLMLAPPEVLDSVVVHELCHRKEMNHSKKFYDEVLRVFPDYRKWNGWLKEHGPELLARVY